MNFFWKNEIDIVGPQKLLGRFFFCAGSKKRGLFVLIRSFCLLRVLKWKLIWKSSLLYLAWPDLGPFSKPHYVFIAWSNYYHSIVPPSAISASHSACWACCWAIFGSCPMGRSWNDAAAASLSPCSRSSFLHAVVLTERCGPALGLPP